MERRPAARGAVRGALGTARGLLAAHPVAAVFLLGFAVRTIVAVIVFVRTGGTMFADDAHYEQMTADAARGRTAGWDPFTERLFRDTWAYTYPLTAVRLATGSTVIAAQVAVAAVGAGVAAVTTRLALEAVPRRWAIGAGVIVCIVPSQVLWSSLLLKDAFVWFVTAVLGLLVALSSRRDDQQVVLVLAVLAALVALWGIRFHTFVIASWSLVVAAALIPHRDRFRRTLGALIVAAALPALLGLGVGGLDLVRSRSLSHWRALNAIDADTAVVDPVITPAAAEAEEAIERSAAATASADASRARQGASKLREEAARLLAEADAATDPARRADARRRARQLLLQAEELDRAAAAAEAEAEARERRAAELRRKAAMASATDEPVIDSAFGDGTLDTSAESNLLYLPRGLALMLLRPYLWSDIDNPNLRLARLEHVVWYPLLLAAVAAVLALWRRRRVLLLPALIGAGSLLASALTEGNFGTAYRHRAELVWVLALAAAVGVHDLLELRRSRRLRIRGAAPGAHGPYPRSTHEPTSVG